MEKRKKNYPGSPFKKFRKNHSSLKNITLKRHTCCVTERRGCVMKKYNIQKK